MRLRSKGYRAEVQVVDDSSRKRGSQRAQRYKQVSFKAEKGGRSQKQRTGTERDSIASAARRSRHACRKNQVCFQEETLGYSHCQFVTVSEKRSVEVRPGLSCRYLACNGVRLGGNQIRAERLASAANAKARIERRTWEGKWKFYYELNVFQDCAVGRYDFYDYSHYVNPVGWVWDARMYSRPAANSNPANSPVLTMSWKHPANPYARWTFDFLQRDFLEKHGERICRDLMLLAGTGNYHPENDNVNCSLYKNNLHSTWNEPVVTMRRATLNTDVKDRFLQACYKNQDAVLAPTYHGTDRSNFEAIFERGLLVPGGSNGVHVLHGQADGPGVYTACLNNPMLSLSFCDRQERDTSTLRSSPDLSCHLDCKQSHQQCTNAGHGKSEFLRKLSVVPWGILGDVEKARNVQRGSAPSVGTAIVDPAGLHYIKTGPGGAGGASGAIYRWLGIARESSFPEDVSEAIQCEGDVALHVYGDRTVIHTVGPDLRLCGKFGHQQAIRTLSICYSKILAKFADEPKLSCLRLLPISGGIFSGAFLHTMPDITVQALAAGFAQFNSEQQCKLLSAMTTIELCIYSDAFCHYAKAVSSYAQEACRENVSECMCSSSRIEKVCSELLVCAVLDDHHGARCSSCSRCPHALHPCSSRIVKHARDALVVSNDAHVVPLFVASISSKPHTCAVPQWRANLCWHNRDATAPNTTCLSCAKITWPGQYAFEDLLEDRFDDDASYTSLEDDRKKAKRIGSKSSRRQLRRSTLRCKRDSVQRQRSKQARVMYRQHSWRQLQRCVLRSELESVQKQRTKTRAHERWEKHLSMASGSLHEDSE